MKKLFSTFLIGIWSIFCAGACYSAPVSIPQNTTILVRTTQDVTSESISPKDNIKAELVSDFIFDGEVLFPKGSEVLLFPSSVSKRGFAGKGGVFEIRSGVITDKMGNSYPLTLRQKTQGDDRDWVVACMGVFTISIILIPLDVIGFIKGKSAILPEGTTIECSF